MADNPLSFHEIKDLDMRIAANGDWFYRGSRIERKNLVRLFSTILRREDDGRYFLQTPVERGEVLVEKAPFMAVLMEVEGEGEAQKLTLETNVGERFVAGPDHPLSFSLDLDSGEPLPLLDLDRGLTARLSRAVFYQLVDLAVPRGAAGPLEIWSGGVAFSLAALQPANRP